MTGNNSGPIEPRRADEMIGRIAEVLNVPIEEFFRSNIDPIADKIIFAEIIDLFATLKESGLRTQCLEELNKVNDILRSMENR